MRITRLIARLGISTAFASVAAAGSGQRPSTTYEVVEKARVCARSAGDRRLRNCEFRVGRSLGFAIAGVGLVDAGIAFSKSDIDGDYYGAFGLEHSCIIVWPGAATAKQWPDRSADAAFVSPVNGKAYRDWPSCHAAKK